VIFERDTDPPPYRSEPVRIRGGKYQLHTYLAEDTLRTIERLAEVEKTTRSGMIRQLVNEAILARLARRNVAF
jgi:hypothetical protein